MSDPLTLICTLMILPVAIPALVLIARLMVR